MALANNVYDTQTDRWMTRDEFRQHYPLTDVWWEEEVKMPEETKIHGILEEAMGVTRSEREAEYDHPLINFARFGEMVTTYLRPKLKMGEWITPVDIAWIMILTKVARAMKTYKRDNVIDTAGYADCIGRMDDFMIYLGYKEGVKVFETMSEDEALHMIQQLEEDAVVAHK